MALLDHGDLTAHGLLVSSRISGEIARKAARSTVAWLASRSIPTTLAVRTAQKVRLPIIGRAAGKHAFIYS
jgi:formate dehydrogenase accessory protein FdhD